MKLSSLKTDFILFFPALSFHSYVCVIENQKYIGKVVNKKLEKRFCLSCRFFFPRISCMLVLFLMLTIFNPYFSFFMVRPHPFLFSTELLTSCLPVSQRKCSCILCILQLYSLYSKILRYSTLFFPYVCQPSPLRWVSDICHVKLRWPFALSTALCQ